MLRLGGLFRTQQMSADSHDTLSIELGNDVTEATCQCCGRATRRISGFVYSRDDARAAYLACWTDGHRDLGAEMVLSIGEWGGAPPAQRVAVALQWSCPPSGPGCVVIDGPSSKWHGRTLLGRLLSRGDVLNSEVGEEAFRIADLIYAEDHRFRAFWEATVQ